MLDSIFKVCYFIGLIAGSVIRAIYTRRYKQSRIMNDHKTVLDSLLMFLRQKATNAFGLWQETTDIPRNGTGAAYGMSWICQSTTSGRDAAPSGLANPEDL